jgi:hypothetical protein
MPEPTSMLPPPPRHGHLEDQLWVDEQIWGHRLWDSESPWLLFLEFLNVALACHRAGQLFSEPGGHNSLVYQPKKLMHLRNVLFNNEVLFRVAERYPDSKTAWAEWVAWMNDHARGVHSPDFAYLTFRFQSFRQFTDLIGMLRGAAVEGETNRRWSSRFIFPFGTNAVYEDAIIDKHGEARRDYINFGRTGELLYLMLCRSQKADALRQEFERFFLANNPWNRLLELFEPPGAEHPEPRRNSYLPYDRHAAFNGLAEDWLHVLGLALPGFDAFPHLVTLGALHVVLYKLAVAAEWSDSPRRVSFICEMVAPKKTLVRELSFLSYQENNLLSPRAVEAYLRRVVTDTAEWHQLMGQPGALAQARELLDARVRWPQKPQDYEGCSDPEALFDELRRVAASRHRQHVANVHRSYGRDVGLVSKRGTNKLRYAPTDALLKALILANVERRMELKEFLARVFERYGLVFGDREAEQVLDREQFDKKAFQANAHRLEQRLGSLGVLRRLSDACAYVQNPFDRRSV